MLDRNRRIKPCPEQFQKTKEEFDVIFTVEERIYDAVIEGRIISSSNNQFAMCIRTVMYMLYMYLLMVT